MSNKIRKEGRMKKENLKAESLKNKKSSKRKYYLPKDRRREKLIPIR